MAETGGILGGILALAGSSLPWIIGLQVVLGSLLIGLVEGALLSLVFRSKLKPSVIVLVIANYGSALLWYWLAPRFGRLVDAASLDRVLTYHGFAAAGLLLAGFAVEWPFVLVLLRARKLRVTLLAAFSVQVPSWIGLILLYSAVSRTGLPSETRAGRARDFASDLPGRVYYIGAADGDLWAVPIHGGETAKVVPLRATRPEDRLFAKEGPGGVTELAAIVHPSPAGSPEEVALLSDLPPGTGLTPLRVGVPDPFAVVDLRSPADRAWTIRPEPGPSGDLQIENRESGARIDLGFATPLVEWGVRDVTVLPGDRIVFEAGGRILLLERETRLLAELARGRCPVVAPEADAGSR